MRIIIGFVFVACQSLDIFERPTLRSCQCGDALGRVKTLHILTLPCQKTNPDGVICSGRRGRRGLCENRIEFDEVLSMIRDESFDTKTFKAARCEEGLGRDARSSETFAWG